MDTFQLIAFLLSVFNIASAMVANANNNNNNNNINDNKFNGNQNDLNEGNANSEVMAMNMIMPGRSLPFPVEATTVRNDKNGDKHVYFRQKREIPSEHKVTKDMYIGNMLQYLYNNALVGVFVHLFVRILFCAYFTMLLNATQMKIRRSWSFLKEV